MDILGMGLLTSENEGRLDMILQVPKERDVGK